MSESNNVVSTGRAGRKRRIITQGVIGAAFLAAVIFAAWYLTSPQFHNWARHRLVSRMEQMTGGRVEIGQFTWNLSRLEFDVRDVTIHGLEGPNEIPYAHADRLLIHARIISLLRKQIALDELIVDRPVVHLIVYPDGQTNQPKPRPEVAAPDVQAVFDLAIKQAELRNGELLVNDRHIAFDVGAGDVQAGMKYLPADNRYDGDIKAKIERARYDKYSTTNAGVDVAFTLRPKELALTGAHVVTAGSKFDGSGTVNNFGDPVVNVNYRATLNALEFAKVFRQPEIRRGTVDLVGTALYAKSALASSGKIVVHGANYTVPGLRVPNIDAAADYVADDQKLTFSHIVARVFGGIAKGDAVVQWAKGSPAGQKPGQEQTGLVRLSVNGIPAGILAEAFSTPQLNFASLHPAGSGQGKVNMRWRGSAARASIDLDVSVTPSDGVNGQLPVSGALKGRYDLAAQQLQAESLKVELPDVRVSAAGTLGSRKGSFHLSTEIADLTRLQPVLGIVKEENSAVAQLAGTLNFDGTLSGKLTAPTVSGHLQVGNLTFPLAAVWTPPPPVEVASSSVPHQQRPMFIHLDSGAADVSYSSQAVAVRHAVIRRAGAQALMDFSIGLQNGAFTDSSPLALHLVLQDAALEDLQQIAGYNYPVSGKIATDLNIHGTRLDLQGGGHVLVTDGVAYGLAIRSAAADVRFADQQAQIANLLLVHDHARVTGSGEYNLKQETFTFQVTGSNFELASIPALNRNRVSVAGRLNFNASGSGTLDAPLVNASAQLQNLVVNGQRVGDARLLAVTTGDTMHVTGHTNFQTAEVVLDGNIRMRDQMSAKLGLQFNNFDFMPLMQSVFHTKFSGTSYVGGTVAVEGPLRNPSALTVSAEIPKLTAEMEGVELHNTEPIRLSVAQGALRLDSFQLTGTDTQFSGRGTMNLAGDKRINLHLDGRLNLKLVQSFDPDITSGGYVDVNLGAFGTLANPVFRGEAKIVNGAVSLIDFPNGLSNLNGTLLFNEERIQVQTLTARTGGGDIRIGGFATYSPGVAFNVTVQGDDVRMRYPQGVSTTGNLDLKLVGNLNSSTLSGNITITRFSFNSQFDWAAYLAKSSRAPEVPRVSPLNNVRFNIHVVSTPQLQVQSSLAKVAGNADLRVRGTPNNPILLGRVNITEGQFDFSGASYRLDRGDISFLNPTRTEPTVDLAATTRVRDYDITLRFSGEPTHGLKTNYSSDPPLPAADIINLLAFGQTREEAQIAETQGTATMTEAVSNAVLTQAINNAVSNRMQKLFGVSRVKISPEVGGAQTNPTAQITIEQQVSNKVTVTYVSNLTQSSQQSIFVEYFLDRNVSVLAGRDQYGVVSFTLKIRQRKR